MKIALVQGIDIPAFRKFGTWYLKVEEVETMIDADILADDLDLSMIEKNLCFELPTSGYCSGAWLNGTEIGIRIPMHSVSLDALNDLFKQHGYILRTLFNSPYAIRGGHAYGRPEQDSKSISAEQVEERMEV